MCASIDVLVRAFRSATLRPPKRERERERTRERERERERESVCMCACIDVLSACISKGDSSST